ncbi:MAG: hypothetical protein J4415_02200 [Candidatus Diapherotrites archaeon]|uniref:Uncharacterized protein n=1 Tax=Candidatus Iainarchaeum sp. TaxID=3101447 RepID=A0A8T4L2W5_9ARCH|nr:hypothetical protein [Candidatus Diapherotrites archaeon]
MPNTDNEIIAKYAKEVKEKLLQGKHYKIIFSAAAKLKSQYRKIPMQEVTNRLRNPENLIVAEPQAANSEGEEKYNCYFGFTRHLAHRYVIIFKHKEEEILIASVIKIERQWQKEAEKRVHAENKNRMQL